MTLLAPPKSWTFDLPEKLKSAIADMVVVYSGIVSCIIETRWLVEVKVSEAPKSDLYARKVEIAREYAHKQAQAIKEIVEAIPSAETDAIWPAMKRFAAERDMCAHGVWMVADDGRPIVVWHSKMLEDIGEDVSGEYFEYARFDHALLVGRQLLKTFAEFKRLLEDAIEEEAAARERKSGVMSEAVKKDPS